MPATYPARVFYNGYRVGIVLQLLAQILEQGEVENLRGKERQDQRLDQLAGFGQHLDERKGGQWGAPSSCTNLSGGACAKAGSAAMKSRNDLVSAVFSTASV